MKIDLFRTLDAVLLHGSFAGAAQALHLTASAVSMQMKQLEQYLGQSLFDRSGHQVRATALAHAVAEAMRSSLNQLQSLRQQPPLSVEGTVRLGIIESVLPVLLPPALMQLRDRFPRLELRPVRGRSAELTAAVKAGELDAAVVAEPSTGGSSRLQWHRLFARELQLIAPPQATEPGAAALFRQYEWIRYDRHSISGALAARWVRKHFKPRHSSLEMDSIHGLVALVSAGLGIGVVHLMDAGTSASHPVRVVRLGRHAPLVQVSMVHRKESAQHRPVMAVRDALAGAVFGRKTSGFSPAQTTATA